MRTWKVIEEGLDFEEKEKLEVTCPACGEEAFLPFQPWIENPIIGMKGLIVIFDKPWMGDPPHSIFPEVIQCRKCKGKFKKEEDESEV